MVKRFNLYREKVFKVDSDLRVRYLAPSDFKYIETQENTFWKFFGEMASGNKCMGLIKDKTVVSYLWVNEKYLECWGIKKRFLGNECMLYNAATKPDMRGNGYAEILRAKVYEILGKDIYYSFTELNNKPALRFKEKIGAEVIATYTYFKLWKFQKLWS